MKVKSKEILPVMDGKTWIKKVYVLSKNNLPFSFRFGIGDRFQTVSKEFVITGSASSGLVWDSGKWDTDSWPAENAIKTRMNGNDGLWGTTIYCEAWQEGADVDFKLLSIQFICEIEKGNFI